MGARVAWMAAAVVLAGSGWAHAAKLTLDAPEACVDPTTLAQEVADLAGRPLGDVPDVDFSLTIRPAENGRWRSTLEAVEHRPGVPQARHLRELEASSCADLGEAAALAMSVSIRAVTEAAASPPSPPPAPPSPRVPDPAILRSAPSPAVHPTWYGLASVSLGADAGDNPGAGLGVSLTVGVGRGLARLNALGGWIAPRDSLRSDATGGGSFQLVYGGAEGCFAPSWGRWTALGCAGGELGAQHGSGLDIARPSSGTALWRALRASAGFVVRSSETLGLRVTATAVRPLARPEFVLDGTSPVYRASPIAGRLDAGLELKF